MLEVPRIGSELAGYRLESVLNRGGMAVVYLAEHIRLRRYVALKILASELSEDDRFRERFLLESRRAAAINHPHIITIHDAGEIEGLLYIAMRYVKGPDLKGLIRNQGAFHVDRALAIVEQARSAIDAAHAHGLIHRDVKPGNLLVVERSGSEISDFVYLTDFGLTKSCRSKTGLTSTGQFLGTVSYAAREQIQGRALDGRADIYSLGCVLYECLTGTTPFDRDDEVATMWAHVGDAPPRITDRHRDLPPALDDVVIRAMAKAPDDRYPSCHALLLAARSAIHDGAQVAPAPVRRPADPTLAGTERSASPPPQAAAAPPKDVMAGSGQGTASCSALGGRVRVTYTKVHSSQASRDSMFAAIKRQLGLDLDMEGSRTISGDCESRGRGWRFWSRPAAGGDVGHVAGPPQRGPQKSLGRMLCFHRAGRDVIEWTDVSTDFYSIAESTAGYPQPVGWWGSQAGPLLNPIEHMMGG